MEPIPTIMLEKGSSFQEKFPGVLFPEGERGYLLSLGSTGRYGKGRIGFMEQQFG